MERFSSKSVRQSLKGSRKEKGYNGNYHNLNTVLTSSSARMDMQTIRFGDGNNKNDSDQLAVPTKLKTTTTDKISPLKLWRKVKNGYFNMMLNLAGNGATNFGNQRVPKARKLKAVAYAPTEFDNRLVLEIHKSMSSTTS